MMTQYSPLGLPRVLVVGAGPAGLAAAVAAAEHGLRVLLVDESAGPGGQYLASAAQGDKQQTKAEREGAVLIARVQDLSRAGSIELAWRATVWSLEPNLTAMIYRGAPGACEAERVRADAVVLATGARETVMPFPGWTLPGVLTVGAAQLLAKRHGVIPLASRAAEQGHRPRVVLSGSGPLLLAAAARLAELGAQVMCVLETTRVDGSWNQKRRAMSALRHSAPALVERRDESWHYLATLRRYRIPYRFGHTVVGARPSSTGRLEAVDVARLDRTGTPIARTRATLPADLLCVGSGLVPNVDLARLAGVRTVYDPALGGWAVAVDEASHVATSVPGLFVAGETAGVSGASGALLSGRIAGLSAAAFTGQLSEAALQGEVARTARPRRAQAHFGVFVGTLFAGPDALYRAIPDETVICRCEEVTAGQVRAAIAAGARSLDALKPAVRVGQGLCQGRTCGPILARLMSVETGRPVEAAGFFRARAPVRPIPLSAIAGAPEPEQSYGMAATVADQALQPGDRP